MKLKVYTTANITLYAYLHLLKVSSEKKIKISTMINDIIKKHIIDKSHNSRILLFEAAHYQPKGGEYKTIHVKFDGEVYEAVSDLRRFRKVSVSSIISNAILAIMEITQNCITKFLDFIKTDNYKFFYGIIPNILSANVANWIISREIQQKL